MDELNNGIADMGTFLREQPTTLTEYNEPLVRRLIDKVTIYEDSFTVEFMSDVTVVVLNKPINEQDSYADLVTAYVILFCLC